MTDRTRVLFVAGLSPVPDGSAGGSVTAATALFDHGLGDDITFVPMSTTMTSNPPPPVTRRALVASGRLVRFCRLARRCDAILIFAGDGSSFVEKGAMCLIAAALGKPTILRPGGGRLAQQCERSALFAWWVRTVLRRVSVVTCQSAYWAGFVQSMTAGRTTVVEIGNGVSVDALPTTRTGGALRVGFLGWTNREKGVFDTLTAFERVLRRAPGAVLRVAGGGRDHAAFVAEVSRRGLTGQVDCLGWLPRDQVPAFLQSLSVLALPSYAEGLPNALLEAMAVGVAVVATPVGGVIDLIRESGGGMLVEPGDIESIANAITTLLTDERAADEIGAKGRRFVRERHDIRVVAAKYRDAVMAALPPTSSKPSASVDAAVLPAGTSR
jgi:glycosyltransferase involved in cell wall biosynthesis